MTLSHTDAIGVVSFGLACGCSVRPTGGADDDHVFLFKKAGCTYPCTKHGEQIIVRSTSRVTGWVRDGRRLKGPVAP